MDIGDSLFKFIKDNLSGGCIFKRDEMDVRGKSVHNDHDSRVSIGFIERGKQSIWQGIGKLRQV